MMGRSLAERSGNTHYVAIRNHVVNELGEHAPDHIVRDTVLLELFRQHPNVGFEDVLELNVVVESPTLTGTLVERVEAILDLVLVHLTRWSQQPRQEASH